jgi:O-antigen ligase
VRFFLLGFRDIGIDLGNGINWEKTSGRDQVYSSAISFIKERPILGYGIFSYWRVMPNPHNLFLEILLSGGIVYFFMFFSLLGRLFIKLSKMIRYDCRNKFWLVIYMYPFIMLMFSGSYLTSSMFWFVGMLVATYRMPLKSHIVNGLLI